MADEQDTEQQDQQQEQDEQVTADGDLGPRPEPQIEPREPNPGGADAVDGGDDLSEPQIPDLSLEENPAVDTDAAPPVLKQGEDTSTDATSKEDAKDVDGATDESSA